MTGERTRSLDIVGVTLGPYQVLEKLGQGGMGEVWKARDTRLNRIVALKILPSATTDDDRHRRFVREAQAASALNHPNIVTIHDIVSDKGQHAIAMEHLAGQTLERLIPPKGMTLGEVLRYGIAIASGVAAAHQAGIVHRDLKPGNVMVTASGQIKVLDFGLAKLSELVAADDDATRTVAGHTEEGTIVGTVSYMSPEQAEGRKVDARSDIFSFGALLYEMVTGERPFHGDTRISTLTSILRDEPKPITAKRPDVPRELERLITRCLRKDAERRYQAMSDVRLALEELQDDSQPSSRTAVVSRSPNKRIAAWGLATLATGAAAVAAWLLWGRAATGPDVPMIIKPVTNYAGFESTPAVSPDGKMIAFSWEGSPATAFNIWVKLLGSAQPLQVTSGLAPKFWPIWSPDSQRIAYTELQVVFEVPALGGQPRRVTAGAVTDWSADGNSLLVTRNPTEDSEGGGVFLVSVADGSARRLTTFSKGEVQESARFSPDGTRVLYTVIESADRSRVMQLPLSGGSAHPLEIEGLRQADIQTILPGGRELIVAGRPDGGQFALFRVPVTGGRPTELPFGKGATAVAYENRRGFVSAAHSVPILAFIENVSNVNVWRVAAWPGPDRKPVRWITSTREEVTPAVSPDGSHIAVSSTRSDASQIWLTDASGANPKRLTSLAGVVVGSPRWSPDGQEIAFDARVNRNPDVWVIPAAGGEPRQLTTESSLDVVPAWSPDSRWIYFTSDRTGRMEIWRISPMGGAPEQITREGGFNPLLSPNGDSVFYLKGRLEGELRRCPADGGKEETIAAEFKSRNFVVLSDGIYGLDGGSSGITGGLQTRPGRAMFYRFKTRKWEDLGFVTDKPVNVTGISLSPDRKWLYYAQNDGRGSDIMLVENFR